MYKKGVFISEWGVCQLPSPPPPPHHSSQPKKKKVIFKS